MIDYSTYLKSNTPAYPYTGQYQTKQSAGIAFDFFRYGEIAADTAIRIILVANKGSHETSKATL